MKCYICGSEGAERRRTNDGLRLYVEPTCNNCTNKIKDLGFDIQLAPKNVAPYLPNKIFYPILKSMKV